MRVILCVSVLYFGDSTGFSFWSNNSLTIKYMDSLINDFAVFWSRLSFVLFKKKEKKRNPETIKEKALPVNPPSVFVPFDSLWEHADCFCLIEN